LDTVLNGKVSLNFNPPSSGATITLTSSDTSAATLPASITLPPGAPVPNYEGTYQITTKRVDTPKTVTITASYNGVDLSYTITVLPPQIVAHSLTPTYALGGRDSVSGKVFCNFPPPAGPNLQIT